MPDEIDQLVDEFDTKDEAVLMSKGRVVLARFPDDPDGPHEQWFWIAVGGCTACRWYRPSNGAQQAHCLHPKISEEEFLNYLHRNTCPAFEAGADAAMLRLGEFERRRLAVMQQIGMVKGTPAERVEVLENHDWDPWVSAQAHQRETHAHHRARAQDSGNPVTEHPDNLGAVRVPLTVRPR